MNALHLEDDFVYRGNLPILITAPAGFGKSSFCRARALRDAETFLGGTGKVIPILVQLHTLSARVVSDFQKHFFLTWNSRECYRSKTNSQSGFT